jgi:response regulator RpfG family c-di-GMP phosphodiesterase
VLYPLSYEGLLRLRSYLPVGRCRAPVGFTAVGKLTVLVIDDDPVILELLRVNFEIEGFDVICAADGEEGFRRAQIGRAHV